VCPPSKQPDFHRRRGGKETRQRTNAPQCVRSLRAPVAQILPSRSDALVVLPVTQADRQPQKGRLHEKSYPSNDEEQSFPVAKNAYESNMGRCLGLPMRGEKRGEIRPAGTISREVMRTCLRRQDFKASTLRLMISDSF
jgi:hypothetical protein